MFKSQGSGVQYHPDHVKGGDIAQIRRVADRFSPHVSYDARSGWGQTRVDSLSTVVIRSLGEERTRMPDVRGMGLKDALFLLENCGLTVRFSGQGTVVSQSIVPGRRITGRETVEIRLQ